MLHSLDKSNKHSLTTTFSLYNMSVDIKTIKNDKFTVIKKDMLMNLN